MEPKPVVATWVLAVEAHARVSAGVGGDCAIRRCDSIDDFFATLDREDVVLAVIDAADAEGRPTAPSIAAIRRRFPHVPVLAYCAFPATTSSAVAEAVRAGVTGLVFRGVDDTTHTMREAIRSARQGAVTRRIYDEISRLLPAPLLPLLRYAISCAAVDPSVEDAAAALGVDRKTLFNRLRDVGSVSPREFINWIRLAIGVGMLEDQRRTAERVALDLGFASGTAFRNMLERYTKTTCSEIRAEGGFDRVLAQFIERLTMRDAAVLDVGAPNIDGRHDIRASGAQTSELRVFS